MSELFIDEHELAKLRKCSVSKLRQDRHKGIGIPYYKIGRKVLYKKTEAIEHIEAHRIQTANS